MLEDFARFEELMLKKISKHFDQSDCISLKKNMNHKIPKPTKSLSQRNTVNILFQRICPQGVFQSRKAQKKKPTVF